MVGLGEEGGKEKTRTKLPNAKHVSPHTTEFKDKKVVVVAVPGAFTPTCSEKHIPTFIEEKAALKAKGVDHVIVIAYNDPFVMSAWGKSNDVTDDFIVSCENPLCSREREK